MRGWPGGPRGSGVRSGAGGAALPGASRDVLEACAAVQARYRVDTALVTQPEPNFLELYAAAKRSAGMFQGLVEAFGAQVGFVAQCRPGGVKSLDRIVEKYQGSDRNLPLDMLAGKVVVPTLLDLYRVALQVGDAFDVVGFRDRVRHPQSSGYRDLHFIVDVGGHYAELKVMHTFFDRVDLYEHRLYEIRRALELGAEVVTLGGPDVYPVLASVEPLVLDTLENTSRELFARAWQMVLGREAGEGPTVTYYLLGQVPVKMEERPGEGVSLVAYDPSRGGYVADARYYSDIKREDREPVSVITEAEFLRQVEHLRQSGQD
ncbi:RelA/SpoT domain-containing protein [Deinococcus aquiradiocola]|uniref:RelA/SpoT domain-containing protein n=1 Tax=Deinococcus aquiradiocola TaxID=393059 RepID=UPI0016648489|nr:RelA/SpoT domain-containing protein [Deinococcus aquiradiocola]